MGSSMAKTVVLIEPTIIPDGVAFLEALHKVVVAPDGSEETLIRCIHENQASAIIPRVELITRRIIEACPSLEVIGQPGVGVDNIDVAACTENGIPVVHAPHGNAASVAEHTLMFILSLSRNLVVWDARVRHDAWHLRDSFLPFEIRDKTLFIIGLGRSGRKVARLAKAFQMRVLGHGRQPNAQMETDEIEKVEDLAKGLSQADFVSLHVPLNEKTHHMISHNEIAFMKKSAFLINVSRGPVVDPTALYEALRSHAIAGAALDVLDREPPEMGHPLLGLKNIIFTPHLAGDTREAKSRCVMTVVGEVNKILCAEKPQYIVNSEILLIKK
jgi:D-3-phosphoglycerate dehydrogenase